MSEISTSGPNGAPPPSGSPGAPGKGQAKSARSRPTDTLLLCLLRLARDDGRAIEEAELRALTPMPETGMTVTAFAQAARRLGYAVRRIPYDGGAAAQLPAPFVLLGAPDTGALLASRREAGKLTLFRPVDGATRTLPIPDTVAMAREALALTRADPILPARGWRSLIADRIKRVAAELTLASLVINGFALATPLFAMTIYNKVIGQQALDTLQVLAIGMAMLYLFDVVLRAIRGYVASHTGARLDVLIGGEVLHRLIGLPYRHFENTPTGVISERLRQLETIRQFFTGQMPMTLVDLGFVFVFVAALWYLSPALAGVVLAAVPVFVGLSFAVHRTQRRLVDDNFAALAAKTSALAETVANALTVKSLALEGEMERRWGSRLALSAWTGFRANNLVNLTGAIGTGLQQAVGLVVLVLGATLVIGGDLTVGALIAANIMAGRALAPMRQVVSAWNQLQEVRSAFRRLDDIMDQPPETEPGASPATPTFEGRIAFERVSFAYEPDLPPVLRDLSFTVEQGEIVGIMGPLGSGKSTLAKLLQGLYRPNAGRILIDRTDIAHASPAALRRQLGVVPQEVQLFAGTVRENIGMGADDPDPARIMASAKFVGAHDFIQRLPKGYETVLRERGTGLSNGQRQLICLARAMMRNPRILILDEATSSLDGASEDTFLTNLRRVARGRTVIIISHRVGPLAVADRVISLADGAVIADGPPSKVLGTAQAARATEAAPEAGAPPALREAAS